MKKITTLLMMALLILSLVPIVLSEDPQGSQEASIRMMEPTPPTDVQPQNAPPGPSPSTNVRPSGVKAPPKPVNRDIREDVRERLEDKWDKLKLGRRLSNISEDQKQKFAELNSEEIEKIKHLTRARVDGFK